MAVLRVGLEDTSCGEATSFEVVTSVAKAMFAGVINRREMYTVKDSDPNGCVECVKRSGE